MSHFSVAVIGDVEFELEPFEECEDPEDPEQNNPNARWDWYEIGGRFAGLLLNNQGYHVNSCRKGDLDWEGMKREAREEAAKEYAETYSILDCEVGAWTSFVEITDQVVRENPDMPNEARMNETRRRYWSQPAFLDKELYRLYRLDKFRCSLEEYVRDNSFCAPFAYVKDRNWVDVSYFGKSVFDDSHLLIREAAFEKMIASLHDDEIITIVDCHI